MTDITVLRVEVSNAGVSKEGTLESGKSKGSLGTSLAAGGVGGKLLLASERERTLKGDDILRKMYPKTESTAAQVQNAKDMKEMFGYDAPKRLDIAPEKKVRKPITYKQVSTGVASVATLAGSAYSMYSNYQKAGYEMSGATHAAAVQGRKSQLAGTAIQIGLAAMINPLLAAPMIAMKAYQLAQTNRKELFEIQKNQMMSQVLQRNLVKTVAERRF
jgi:hypothetical protein